jgi:hypothetical protein
MTHQDLEQALKIVQRELSRAEHLDAEEVAKLKATMEEIQAVLGQQTSEEEESLSERVASSARRFEESHPILTENLGRIADILQQMGF